MSEGMFISPSTLNRGKRFNVRRKAITEENQVEISAEGA
jgi:hypothetical protein